MQYAHLSIARIALDCDHEHSSSNNDNRRHNKLTVRTRDGSRADDQALAARTSDSKHAGATVALR